jgi:hypothetical protein
MMYMHPGGSVKSKLFLLALVLAAATTNLTHAHHSFAASYFPDRTVTIDGKVVQFLFRNPHSFLDVAPVGEKRHDETWVVEWGGGGQLSRVGVSKDTLKPGDHVVVIGNPSRNPTDHRLHMVSIFRPSDGWKWSGDTE